MGNARAKSEGWRSAREQGGRARRPERRAARPPARAGTACTRARSRVAGSSAGAPAAACSGRAWSDSACHRSPLALARMAEDGADRPRSAPSMDGARSHALQRQVIFVRRSCLRARRRPRLSRRARDVTRELWAAPRGRHAPEGAFWRVESHREAQQSAIALAQKAFAPCAILRTPPHLTPYATAIHCTSCLRFRGLVARRAPRNPEVRGSIPTGAPPVVDSPRGC